MRNVDARSSTTMLPNPTGHRLDNRTAVEQTRQAALTTEVGTNQGGDSIHFLHQLGSPLRASSGRVSCYPEHAFMGSLPRVTSQNGILTFTITDLHLLDKQCHTCCMAQCIDLLQPMSIISAASVTAPAASTAVTTAAMTQTVISNSQQRIFQI